MINKNYIIKVIIGPFQQSAVKLWLAAASLFVNGISSIVFILIAVEQRGP